MKLSQSVTYAIHATVELASTEGSSPVSCGQLAQRGNMPERFLLQILRDLAKQGILQSSRGGGGGFKLQRPAEEVSLLNIIEAVDGPQKSRLPVNVAFPRHAQAVLESKIEGISDMTREQLDALKLSHLISPATEECPDLEQGTESIDVVGTMWPIVERIAG